MNILNKNGQIIIKRTKNTDPEKVFICNINYLNYFNPHPYLILTQLMVEVIQEKLNKETFLFQYFTISYR